MAMSVAPNRARRQLYIWVEQDDWAGSILELTNLLAWDIAQPDWMNVSFAIDELQRLTSPLGLESGELQLPRLDESRQLSLEP